MTEAEIDALLAAALRDGSAVWPAEMPDADADRIVAGAVFHGVAALLHARMGDRARAAPGRLADGLRTHALGGAMRELGERAALVRLLPALAAAGARPLLFKGAALAYGLYDDPASRERADTDILIAPSEREAARDALTRRGWRHQPGMPGELASGQASYALAGPGEASYHVDLHWRISNGQVLAALFDHDALWRRSVPLPALHAEARGPCPVDALLIACMHRLVHATTPYYSDGTPRVTADRLIWLHDIRLLAAALSGKEWEDFARRAVDKGLAEACRDGLLAARAQLGARCPAPVLERLADASGAETPSAYLRAGQLRREWMDFRALRGASARLRFLAEIALPPADYVRGRQPSGRPGWLPWLYARRAAGGIAKRLRRRPGAAGHR